MNIQQAFEKFKNIATIIASLLPLVLQFVKTVEAEFPLGAGTQKLAVVRAWLEVAFDKVDDFGVTFDDLWPRIASLIGTIVAGFNATGFFRRMPAPAAPSNDAGPTPIRR